MIKYGALHKALSQYTHEDIHEVIPIDYYRRVIKACFRANNTGLSWDINHAASILLYLALNEDQISPSQLNKDGLASLDSAEKLLTQAQADSHKNVINALRAS